MALTKYANTNAELVSSTGGSVRMTIATNAAQGNGGTSLPCRRVYLLANNNDVRVTIGVACTSTTGIPVPLFLAATGYQQPLEIRIDDVSKLYFYGATNDKVVDCLYMN